MTRPMADWPQPLQTVHGPFKAARVDGAAAGMGVHGPATRAVIDAGYLPPDQVCGMTLFLLARQPRPARAASQGDGDGGPRREKASPIDGGVWVRERFTVHRPLARDDPFTIDGASEGRFVRKGRRYGVNTSRSHDSAGRLVASNLTCGLLSYRAEAGADQVEGRALEDVPPPQPDHRAAAANPAIERLRAARVDDIHGGRSMVLSLAMMAARDTANPDNPIHSDAEAAAAAGLAKPIAGGSHVMSFAVEGLLAAWGPESLSHGACFDVRWRAPVEADDEIVPSAIVTAVDDRSIEVSLEVALGRTGVAAMVGTVIVPTAA